MATAVLPLGDTASKELTVADLAERFGSLPAWRVRTDVRPGTATEEDVERLRRDGTALCELIDGVLVEKAVSDGTSMLAMEIGRLLGNHAIPGKLGWVLGSDGFVRLFGTRLRAPDVAFVRKDQRPRGPLRRGYADGAPVLAVEVFSPGNTRQEMAQKRAEYFANGAELVWVVYPETQTVEVATGAESVVTVGRDGMLTGGPVLPGFAVRVADIFDAVDLGAAADS